jgi:hypothetical protein
MKWLKFHTSYIFAYSMAQDELPLAPGTFEEGEQAGGIVGGNVGRALRTVMSRGRAGNWPSRRCAYDILMSKLGDPVAPPDFVENTFLDHKKALTREEMITDRETDVILSRVKGQIDNICDKLFRYKLFSHKDPLPSLRACYENKLSEAGAFGELLMGFEMPVSLDSDQLFGMTWTAKEGCQEIRFIPGDDVVAEFQDYVDDLWESRLDERLEAVPVPILEPLKVRMITKGQAAEYYRTIELQKFMHSALRAHPIFQYIGHPIDDESWVEAFRHHAELPVGKFYVSGDYKAATDNLRPELSIYAWEAICSRTGIWQDGYKRLIDTPYAALGRKALCGHRLHYPDEVVVDQTWGQLMGSPMSFPILCLVNAAATLAALDWRFAKNLPLRVNGDDIGFIADDHEYWLWKKFTGACGLEFSIGKNYTSREFLIINSELRRPPEGGMVWRYNQVGYEGVPDSDDDPWRCTIRWVQQLKPWKLEGFLNQSILYHRVKKGVDAGQEKDVYWTDLESLSHEAIRGIPDKSQWRVLSIFLKAHASVLEETPPLCNIWFPRSLGGAGVAIPYGKTLSELCGTRQPDLLEKQQKVAAYLACNPNARLKRVCPFKRLIGKVSETLDDILRLSNQQVKPVLRNKPLRREQKTMLGGKTLLGYLIRGLSGETSLGGELRKESTAEDQTGRMHRKESLYLRHKFFNWTRNALHTSLEPMRFDHISGYQEHLEMYAHIELLSEGPTSRKLDHSGVPFEKADLEGGLSELR